MKHGWMTQAEAQPCLARATSEADYAGIQASSRHWMSKTGWAAEINTAGPRSSCRAGRRQNAAKNPLDAQDTGACFGQQ